ncbi:MAG: AN1-type zinc finger domain-containing protein [Candidatus Bathyarchaeia archaeon]
MKCQRCGQETFLPFRCPYCEGYFCSEHRLPESHECPKMELARASKWEIRQDSYTYTVTYSTEKPKSIKRFSKKEIKHLTIAALLVFCIGLSSGILSFGVELSFFKLFVFALAFTLSFLVHEIAHKIVAQMEGLWAEFRLTVFGAFLTLLSIFSLFKIISPGAVIIAGFADKKSVGRVSIAGPLTNLVLAIILLGIAVSIQHQILGRLAYLNAFIALFNLLPFGVLDGFKIFLWSKKIWVMAFMASLILTVVALPFAL